MMTNSPISKLDQSVIEKIIHNSPFDHSKHKLQVVDLNSTIKLSLGHIEKMKKNCTYMPHTIQVSINKLEGITKYLHTLTRPPFQTDVEPSGQPAEMSQRRRRRINKKKD